MAYADNKARLQEEVDELTVEINELTERYEALTSAATLLAPGSAEQESAADEADKASALLDRKRAMKAALEAGITRIDEELAGSGDPPTDETPPTISNLLVEETEDGAVISFDTDVAANAEIAWGASADPTNWTDMGTDGTTHSYEITGVGTSTEQHYRVRATRDSLYTTTSDDATFTTLAAPPAGPGAGMLNVADKFGIWPGPSGTPSPAEYDEYTTDFGRAVKYIRTVLSRKHNTSLWDIALNNSWALFTDSAGIGRQELDATLICTLPPMTYSQWHNPLSNRLATAEAIINGQHDAKLKTIKDRAAARNAAGNGKVYFSSNEMEIVGQYWFGNLGQTGRDLLAYLAAFFHDPANEIYYGINGNGSWLSTATLNPTGNESFSPSPQTWQEYITPSDLTNISYVGINLYAGAGKTRQDVLDWMAEQQAVSEALGVGVIYPELGHWKNKAKDHTKAAESSQADVAAWWQDALDLMATFPTSGAGALWGACYWEGEPATAQRTVWPSSFNVSVDNLLPLV